METLKKIGRVIVAVFAFLGAVAAAFLFGKKAGEVIGHDEKDSATDSGGDAGASIDGPSEQDRAVQELIRERARDRARAAARAHGDGT